MTTSHAAHAGITSGPQRNLWLTEPYADGI